MKNVFLIILFAAVISRVEGETPQFNLPDFNAESNKIQKTGMIVLGSWAVLNFAGSGVPLLFALEETIDGSLRYFMLMNIGWNLINATLAGTGYFNCCKESPGEISLAGTVKRQYNAEKTFLFNAGLDVGYIGFGLFLTELAEKSGNPDLLRGFGYSLVVQGAALFAFDVAMQIIHATHRKKLDSYLAGLK